MSIADLLSDESFINFCKRSSPEDIVIWESYIRDNPGRRELVENARAKFTALFNAMAMADQDEQESCEKYGAPHDSTGDHCRYHVWRPAQPSIALGLSTG